MRVHKAKCKVLYLGWDNLWYQYRLGDEGNESSPAETTQGYTGGQQAALSQQCVLAAQKDNCILSYIKRCVASKLRNVILPLCFPLMRHHCDSVVPTLPFYAKVIATSGGCDGCV